MTQPIAEHPAARAEETDDNRASENPGPDGTHDNGSPAGDQTLFVAASNALGFDLYREARKKEGNLLFSPASISVAFAMTYAGAAGETAAQMRAVLHLPEGDTIHESAGSVLRGWNADAGHTLRVVNRLFALASYTFLPRFLARTRDSYDAPLEAVDFVASPENARKQINTWVMDQTQDRIEELLPDGSITADTRLVLVNAIYFLGTWANEFKVSKTTRQPFLTAKGKTKVPMMSQTATHRYAEVDGAQILELAYADSTLAMTIILPKDPQGLATLEQQLSVERLQSWIAALALREVVVELPRFELKNARIALKDSLEALGMTLPFNSAKADFSAMSKPGSAADELYISDTFHEAFVKVDEKGTEAAAATAVVMTTRGRRPIVTTFRADHPFLFAIRDVETGVLMFLGRLAEPS